MVDICNSQPFVTYTYHSYLSPVTQIPGYIMENVLNPQCTVLPKPPREQGHTKNKGLQRKATSTNLSGIRCLPGLKTKVRTVGLINRKCWIWLVPSREWLFHWRWDLFDNIQTSLPFVQCNPRLLWSPPHPSSQGNLGLILMNRSTVNPT